MTRDKRGIIALLIAVLAAAFFSSASLGATSPMAPKEPTPERKYAEEVDHFPLSAVISVGISLVFLVPLLVVTVTTRRRLEGVYERLDELEKASRKGSGGSPETVKLIDAVEAGHNELRTLLARLSSDCKAIMRAVEKTPATGRTEVERQRTAAETDIDEILRPSQSATAPRKRQTHTIAKTSPDRSAESFNDPKATNDSSGSSARTPNSWSSTVTTLDLLKQVQRAAAAILVDGQGLDAATLSAAVASQMPDAARAAFVAKHYQVCAHNSAAQLVTDFGNPDFFSITALDGHGWLIPNPRALFANSFAKYYGGDNDGWPGFSLPATCTVDTSGQATLVEKGKLS